MNKVGPIGQRLSGTQTALVKQGASSILSVQNQSPTITQAAKQAAAMVQQKALAQPRSVNPNNPINQLFGEGSYAPATSGQPKVTTLGKVKPALPRTAAGRMFGPQSGASNTQVAAAAEAASAAMTKSPDEALGNYTVPEPEPMAEYFEEYQDATPAPDTYSPQAGRINASTLSVASNPGIGQPKKEGFWVRLLALFGLTTKAQAASMGAETAQLSRGEAAQSLIDRARAGDQNAMAIIALVRDNAKKGNTQARLTAGLMKEYIKKNPVSQQMADMGYEAPMIGSDQNRFAAAVKLSHQGLLTNPRIEQLVSSLNLSPSETAKFVHGLKTSVKRNKPHGKAGALAETIGIARALQAVRMPHSPIRKLNPTVAWELGE